VCLIFLGHCPRQTTTGKGCKKIVFIWIDAKAKTLGTGGYLADKLRLMSKQERAGKNAADEQMLPQSTVTIFVTLY